MKGEFEKRIKETLEKAETNDIAAFAVLMMQDIDEMRKEFPKLGVGGSDNPEDIRNFSDSIEEAYMLAETTLQEVKEWFEKYFGIKEEE